MFSPTPKFKRSKVTGAEGNTADGKTPASTVTEAT
jgi:hypothetical protein